MCLKSLAWGGGAWRLPSRVFLAASAAGGWDTVADGYDARFRHQVPGGSQLPLVFTDYVPITAAMTLCRPQLNNASRPQ